MQTIKSNGLCKRNQRSQEAPRLKPISSRHNLGDQSIYPTKMGAGNLQTECRPVDEVAANPQPKIKTEGVFSQSGIIWESKYGNVNPEHRLRAGMNCGTWSETSGPAILIIGSRVYAVLMGDLSGSIGEKLMCIDQLETLIPCAQ